MFRMNVIISSPEPIFTPESLEFLKKFELWDYSEDKPIVYESEDIYKIAVENITDPNNLDIYPWPSYFENIESKFNPDDFFSALLNHFKVDGMGIYVEGDAEKLSNEDYNIPDEYGTPFYELTFDKNDFDEDEFNEGKIRIALDGDNAFVYDSENDEKTLTMAWSDFLILCMAMQTETKRKLKECPCFDSFNIEGD